MTAKKNNRFAALYSKLEAFSVESLFVRKRPPGPRRHVFVNKDLPGDYWDHKKKKVKREHTYTSNQVITSKYTIITFLPRNLLEQFRRIANIFFLAIAILQFFDKFSTISPGLVLLPLLIVLSITAGKDAYEDVKRHQSDRRVNYSTTRVLQGGDWNNHNVMQPKTKTFLRGIIPKRFHAEKPNTGDLEKAENVGEGSAVDAPEGHPPQIPDDIEFDEGEEPGHHEGHNMGLLHHDQHMGTPHWKKTLWEDVRVGDIVKIYDNESIPADVLICATSEEENEAYVETKNLDGETNLKSRRAVPSLAHLNSAKECAKPENNFQVDLDSPENNMFRLNAAVRHDGKQVPADISMVLLRGTVLRNTAWVIGVVLFTGEDTKIVQNSGGTPSKRSKVERQMNPQVFLNLILLAAMAVACGIVDSILEQRYYDQGAPWLYGANLSDDNPKINGLVTWAFALITFQNIVPISLYISIEAVRTVQAAFIFFDTHIYYDKTKQATLARSWNLSDDLGQIEYIFSDKTGTLTQNSMIFRQCSVGAKVYNGGPDTEEPAKEDDDSVSASSQTPTPAKPTVVKHPVFRCPELLADIRESLDAKPNSPSASHARMLNGFFTVLGLCHTVLTSEDKETGKIDYKAQSPDEAALVRAAADAGYVFRGRDREFLYLQTPMSEEHHQQQHHTNSGSETSTNARYEKYELLNILEFTSARKRMSVVVRKLDQEDKRVFLLMKGADNVIFERLKPGVDVSLREQTEMHLSEFANNGLRTLTLAYKMVPNDEYEAWSEKYHEASVSMGDREEKLDAVADMLEKDVRLLGATAIEDSLQDGVPETIHDLKRAGIKIWVATGDKLETAIAIGHSTNLIDRESNIIVIRGGADGSRTVYEQMMRAAQDFFPDSSLLEEHGAMFDFENPRNSASDQRSLRRSETGVSSIVGSNNGDRPGGFVLVIDGAGLTHALGDDKHKDLLLRLAMHCEGVICCRVSPLQKALVVRLVKDGLGAMTLAIGDGANDVSMIQAAHVGVGISGEEGLQAVNASDYAIAQFRFLKRLILVHGHWSYARNGNMIVNFFFKNIVCIGVLWWFQIYCGWSSAYAFEYTYLLFWNSFWTIAPPIAIGIFDRIVDDHVLMDLPELYRWGREGRWFGMKSFLLYVFDAVYQSAIIFFFIKYTYETPTTRLDGYGINMIEMTTPMVFAAVTAADLFNGLNTNVWTSWVFFAVFVGIFLLWVYTPIYALISPGWFSTPVYGNYDLLFTAAYFYLVLPITICLALLPRYVAKAYKFIYRPDDIDIMRWMQKVDPNRSDYSKDVFLSGLEGMRGHRHPSDAHLRRSMDSLASNSPHSHSHLRPSTLLPHQSSVSVSASRTDMSTGKKSVHRGFDFHTEEGGVSIRRMQSNLSSRRNVSQIPEQSQTEKSKHRGNEGLGRVLSVSKSLLRRKPRTPP
ncbi:phospholipid-translocating P-type ATPase [Marasmius fiardii PR-910]|nr:phospholipid-translocating P-type ATPase [Marasmius fiardii PR-910]